MRGRSLRTGAECLGKLEGTRPASSGRVWKNLSMFQEQKNLGSSQVYGVDHGSVSTFGSDIEMG